MHHMVLKKQFFNEGTVILNRISVKDKVNISLCNDQREFLHTILSGVSNNKTITKIIRKLNQSFPQFFTKLYSVTIFLLPCIEEITLLKTNTTTSNQTLYQDFFFTLLKVLWPLWQKRILHILKFIKISSKNPMKNI